MNRRTSWWSLIAILAVGLVFLNAGCTQNQESASGSADSTSYDVGLVLPQTGNYAELGEPKMNAFQIAADEINGLEGTDRRQLSLHFGDNQGQPKEGVSVMKKMINVNGISSFYMDITAVALQCVSTADNNEAIMFAGSAHPTITEGSKWVFRVFTSGAQEADLLSRYLENQGTEEIYILHVNDPLGNAMQEILEKQFSASGGEVLGHDSFEIGGQQFRSVLTKIKAANPDKLVMLGYGVAIPRILEQARQLGIPNEKIVGNIGFVGPGVLSLEPQLTEGIVFTGPAYTYRLRNDSLRHEATRNFVRKYRERYQKTPDYTAAFAYDALNILYKAMKGTGGNTTKIRQHLLQVEDYSGVSGDITILPNGDSRTDVMLASYRNGEIVPVSQDTSVAQSSETFSRAAR